MIGKATALPSPFSLPVFLTRIVVGKEKAGRLGNDRPSVLPVAGVGG